MWIRDSTAQIHPYLTLIEYAENNVFWMKLIEGVLHQQSFFINADPYCTGYYLYYHHYNMMNSYSRKQHQFGLCNYRLFEIDHGCYFFWLLYSYWRLIGKKNDILEYVKPAVVEMLTIWEIEQNHMNLSEYRSYDLRNNGMGRAVKYTGMIWSCFRPSDDRCQFGYNIPSNLFAVVTLHYVSKMYSNVAFIKNKALKLKMEVLDGVNKYGIKDQFVKDGIYCYEVDGLGNCNKMDDANIPSLLSIPYFDSDTIGYKQEYDMYEAIE